MHCLYFAMILQSRYHSCFTYEETESLRRLENASHTTVMCQRKLSWDTDLSDGKVCIFLLFNTELLELLSRLRSTGDSSGDSQLQQPGKNKPE